MMSLKWVLCLVVGCSCANVLFQGSVSMQVNDQIAGLSGLKIDYQDKKTSAYDLAAGYLFSIKDVVVVPVMVEGKIDTLKSYLDPESISEEAPAPLELAFKPGLRLTDSDIYLMLGCQVGDFKQNEEQKGYHIDIKIKPSFYGVGYTKGLSDYLDYITELKMYFDSEKTFGLDTDNRTIADDFTVVDSRIRLGLRLKF